MDEGVLMPPKKPRINLSVIRKAAVFLILAILVFAAGYSFGMKGYKVEPAGYAVTISRDLPEEKKELSFDMFWKIWDTLETSYFDKTKLDTGKMVLGAIKGMVASVGDPYTIFLTPDEQRVTQEDLNGNFEGVGIQIGFKGSNLAVTAPLVGSPAEKAGVLAGDIIAGIKDEGKGIERGTVGITLPEAVNIIRGEAGSTVTLSLIREGEDQPIIVDLVRQEINVPSVALEFVGANNNIAHIKLMKFGGETYDEWNEAVLKILTQKNLEGVIVDVRNNPGGYLQGAVDLGSEFLQKGDVVVSEEYANGSKDEFFVENTGRLTREKVVVLINGGSASASEILAGALRDKRQFPLVGDKSFGKGTVQEAKELEGAAGLHITVAKWLTPSGTWVHQTGLTPDYEVSNDPATVEDEQLARAIDVLNNLSSLSGR